MCLRAACRYDPEKETLLMHNGMLINKSQVKSEGLGLLVEPIFEFAVGLSKLQLDKTELSLLSAVLLMQSGKCRICMHILKGGKISICDFNQARNDKWKISCIYGHRHTTTIVFFHKTNLPSRRYYHILTH